MTDPVPAGPNFDHALVDTLLRIVHATAQMPGMETIRDAAVAKLNAIAVPIKAAAVKAAEEVKAKAAARHGEAVAKHKGFPHDTAVNLTALAKNVDDTELVAEKVPTPENIATHEAAKQAYADALKVAEVAAHPPKAVPANQMPPNNVSASHPNVADSARRV